MWPLASKSIPAWWENRVTRPLRLDLVTKGQTASTTTIEVNKRVWKLKRYTHSRRRRTVNCYGYCNCSAIVPGEGVLFLSFVCATVLSGVAGNSCQTLFTTPKIASWLPCLKGRLIALFQARRRSSLIFCKEWTHQVRKSRSFYFTAVRFVGSISNQINTKLSLKKKKTTTKTNMSINVYYAL